MWNIGKSIEINIGNITMWLSQRVWVPVLAFMTSFDKTTLKSDRKGLQTQKMQTK